MPNTKELTSVRELVQRCREHLSQCEDPENWWYGKTERCQKELDEALEKLRKTPNMAYFEVGYGQLYPMVKRYDYEKALRSTEYLQKIHEQTDGLQSVIVTQEEIFNEFSGGRITPIAIRDFVRNVYNKSAHRLKFLMLCGDGSYDNRKINLDEKILTYQTNYSLNDIASIVTDDFYTLLDEGEGITENDIKRIYVTIISKCGKDGGRNGEQQKT